MAAENALRLQGCAADQEQDRDAILYRDERWIYYQPGRKADGMKKQTILAALFAAAVFYLVDAVNCYKWRKYGRLRMR